MGRLRPPKATHLTGKVWVAADLGEIRLATATNAVASLIDQTRPPHRGEEDIHLAWRWADIVRDMREAYVVRADEELLAIWASKVGSPIAPGDTKYYRLDYLEIAPTRRGDGQTFALAMALVSKRAAEHRAEGVVLTAFRIDGVVRAYEYLGAERGAPPGWNYP